MKLDFFSFLFCHPLFDVWTFYGYTTRLDAAIIILVVVFRDHAGTSTSSNRLTSVQKAMRSSRGKMPNNFFLPPVKACMGHAS